MNKALANNTVFVSAYLVFMLLTYYLPSLGAEPLVAQGIDGNGLSSETTSLLPLFLNICAMLFVLWISYARGVIIGERWIVLLPMVAFAFDLIPKLSGIPIVPSIYHLLAIIVGVACPIISTMRESKLD